MRITSNTSAILATRAQTPVAPAPTPEQQADERVLGTIKSLYEVPLARLSGLIGLDPDHTYAAVDRLRAAGKALLIKREDGELSVRLGS